jgi:hypothetical protein
MSVQDQAKRLDTIVAEAEKLAEHARIAAIHFRTGEVPRGAAHTLSAEGHFLAIRAELDAIAREHAARSQPVI